jgi:hypothetical protein
LIGSLALHGLFLLLPLRDPPQPDSPPSLQIDRLVTIIEPIEPEPEPEPTPEAPPEPPPGPPPEPITEPTPPPSTPEDSPPTKPNQQNQPNQLNPLLLRRQILATSRDLNPEAEDSDEPDPLAPAAVPELPGSSGWINEYIGPVSAGVEHWQSNYGSRSTRIVLPGGQIICGRAEAPTSAELFNPSFALNMMFFRECGRQRPEPADRNDPWLRAPRESP